MNPLAKRLAIEIGDTGTELPIGIVPANWDASAGTAVIYPEFTPIAQNSLFHLYWGGPENPLITELAATPGAPSVDPELAAWNLAVTDALWQFSAATNDWLYTSLIQRYEIDVTTVDVNQPYGIATQLDDAVLEQLYSMLMEVWMMQLYGDVPVITKSLVQPYSGAAILEKSLLQKWGAALEMETSLIQPWQMPETMKVISEQHYGIIAQVLQVVSEQLYNINERTTLFADLVQPYAMAAETAQLYVFDTKIFINGERIPFHTVEWQASSEYAWSCDFSVKSFEVANKCVDGASILITSAGDSYVLKCYGGWRLDRRFGETLYRVEGYSPARDLDLAEPITGDLAGMASQIAADLAAIKIITLDWQMADGYIAPGKLTASAETPLAVLRKLVNDAHGRLVSTADGTLLCVPDEETTIPDWHSITPAQVIDARLERIATTWQNDTQPGYNLVIVSDQLAAGNSERSEQKLLDSHTADLRMYVTPLADSPGYEMTHSGGTSVTIEPMGIGSEPVVDELVEIKGGVGQTSLPIYSIEARSWAQTSLGDIQFSEDGIIKAATSGYSLLKLSYTTKFYQWIGRDPQIETVQFVARRAD